MKNAMKHELGGVKLLVMDVDGTLTDGKVYISSAGEAMKAFNIKDGYGIYSLLPKYGITPAVITGRKSRIVELRCEELGIDELHQGELDKLSCLKRILERRNFSLADVAYIGDDLLDLPCMEAVQEAGGIAGCPADAVKEVAELCAFVSNKSGGDGAVREFIEWLTLQ